MKKIFLSLLVTAIMTSFSAYASNGGGKKAKSKKAAKTECCKKAKCTPTGTCDRSKCEKPTCTPMPGCGGK